MQEIQKEALVQTLENMKKRYDYLKNITAVDYPDGLEVVYVLYSTVSKEQELVKVKLPHENPGIESVVGVYPSADWHERELFEMFGIKILGRKVSRLLLEKWNGVDPPLLKSFEWGKDYRKIK